MDIEEVIKYCINKQEATESFPFDDKTLVIKVLGKMFCLLSLAYPPSINLKCDPEQAIELREEFLETKPGFHMNKKHWNTIELEGGLPKGFIFEMIDNSYRLVVANLPLKKREKIIL